MTSRRRVLINAAMSVVQVVVIGGAFFVLYRFVIDQIGMADFGVWALVLAVTNASSVANLGLAAGAVKFVAKYRAHGDDVHTRRIVETSLLALAGMLGILLLALYPALGRVVDFLIDEAAQRPAAHAILPYALASFWLSSIAGVVLSCLDGFQRVDLRSLLLTVATLAYLGLAFGMVPRAGLIGLAQAQLAQAALLLVAAWLTLRRLDAGLPWLPHRWSTPAFREMLRYSLNFQVISFSKLLFEPLTKALMAKFGGVTALGFFEFAYRMVFQLRALIATAHQSLVPAIADLQVTDPARLRDLYTTSFRLLLFLILPSLPFLLALTPFISRVWIGAVEPLFVQYALLLFVGWFLNIFSGPAYFANLGTGELRWNVIGHLVTGVLNGGLGLLLGWHFGGMGVVVGFVVGILVGSTLTVWAYHRRYRIRLPDVLDRASGWLGGAAVLGLVLAMGVYRAAMPVWPWLPVVLAMMLVYLAAVAVPWWRHPSRARLQAWVLRR